MAVTIKLDAGALRALIADDDAFKLELQRSVTAEVVRNFVMKDAAEIAKAVMPTAVGEVVAQLRDDATFQEGFANHLRLMLIKDPASRSAWNAPLVLNPAVKEKIASHLDGLIKAELKEAGALAEQTLTTLTERVEGWLAREVPGAIARDVDRKVLAAIDRGVDERLALLRASLK